MQSGSIIIHRSFGVSSVYRQSFTVSRLYIEETPKQKFVRVLLDRTTSTKISSLSVCLFVLKSGQHTGLIIFYKIFELVSRVVVSLPMGQDVPSWWPETSFVSS